MRRYDDFAEKYNAIVIERRENDPANREKYQTLKSTHHVMFRDIVFELAKNMNEDIRRHEKIKAEQGNDGLLKILSISNPLCGNGYFVCRTNRMQLSKHSKKGEYAVYRNILRLMEAGIIKAKIGHGKKACFELHINAHFLLVSDRMNPEYNPLAEWQSPDNECAFRKVEEILLEQLKYTLYSAYAVDKVNLPQSGADVETEPNEGQIGVENQAEPDNRSILPEQRGCQNAELGPEAHPADGDRGGGRADWQKFNEANNEIRRLAGREYNKNPQWHAMNRLFCATYFVDYLIEKIYTKRGVSIYPEARTCAIEYAEKYYFPNPTLPEVRTKFEPCEKIESYNERLLKLCWCIDAANRWAAKYNKFFVMINQYIDLENENGFAKTFDWWLESKQNELDKRRHARNKHELKCLHDAVRTVLNNPNRETYERMRTYVLNNLPKYEIRFERSVSSIINKIQNE